MKLYFSPGACSLAPHIALREASLDFELVKVDVSTKRTASGDDFFSINPKGYVPVLGLDEGGVLTEVQAILQYIADQAPAAHLAPVWPSLERYRLMEWLSYISSELHKNYSPLFKVDASEDIKTSARANLSTRLSFVAVHLQNRQFLLGEIFTVADAYLFTVLRWSRLTHIDFGAVAGFTNLSWRHSRA